ncbi:MAG: hypothetical protein Q8M01_04340 [Rubrivivax sp.]|nr:hypothetical protein [Rubrivivax sp.]
MTAPNDEGHRWHGTPQEQTLQDAPIVAQAPDARNVEPGDLTEKVRATLAAQLALAGGFVLLDLADGSYLVTRWNASRHCVDLQAVANFARQVGCTR